MLQVQKKFWGRRPGLDLGDAIHLGVNLLFVAALFVTIRSWHSPLLAAALVALSKWRVLAVQARFWLPNIKANLVDGIVGLSTVMLMYLAPSDGIALFWAALFAGWLLYLKPQTGDSQVGAQALWAQMIGLIAVFATSWLLEVSFIGLVICWVIAWSSARHYLGNYEEPHYKALSLVWGFIVIQIVWVGMHWIQYYRISGVNISAVALIVTVLGATLGVLFHAYKSEKLHKSLFIENVIFGAVLLAIIMATSSWVSQI